jgi:hypothetical protein
MSVMEFCLGVAQEVLSKVLTDFIIGRRQAINRSEIEEMVRQILKEQPMQQININELTQEIYFEVTVLSEQLPDVVRNESELRRSEPTLASALSNKGEAELNSLLATRLRRLNELVAARRSALAQSMEAEPAETSAERLGHDVEPVSNSQDRSDWQGELRLLKERIYEARSSTLDPFDG